MYKIIGSKEKTIKNLGGKGFNLLKLDKFELTPNFFIISNSIFNEYLKKDFLLYDYLRNNFPGKINLRFIKRKILQFKPNRNLLSEINNALNQLNINKLIIRSSFISEDSKNLSYAGLFSSYRCQKRTNIFNYIKKVWASQFSERVFNYQKEKKDFKYGMAVIIQDFIQPDFSGVCFVELNLNKIKKIYKIKEIYIEYCEKNYRAIESGTKAPFVFFLRDGYFDLTSVVSKSHYEWIKNLIEKVSILQNNLQTKRSSLLDIEFAISRDKIYLLQIRPLTTKINIEDLPFVVELPKKCKYHIDDFSIPEFKKVLKEININFLPKIKKEKNGILLPADSYFLFFDELKNKSTNLEFLNNFYKYFLEFISSEYKKAKEIPNNLFLLVSIIKKLNFKMSILDFIHNSVLEEFKRFLRGKYHLKEDKHLEYFAPPISFSIYKFLLNKGGFLEQLDKRRQSVLINNIKNNQKKILKILAKLNGKQKKYFVILKKLIWLRDVVDYYYGIITSLYGSHLSSIFKRRKIRPSFKNPLEICRFSMNKIKLRPNLNFPSDKKMGDTYQRNYAFPLRGTVASKGNFSGFVKIIRDNFDTAKITPKNILVAKYTQPSLVVGMAICKGIITEEGGLTSHAAIVSRELGKPCLIGVEACTNILKDGDKIKVINGKIYKLN